MEEIEAKKHKDNQGLNWARWESEVKHGYYTKPADHYWEAIYIL